MNLHNWGNKKIINESASQYMQGMHEGDDDLVQEARGKKIADPLRAKLMGMEDIRDLKGTMTPRYFATKVIRYLQKENPELDLEDLTDDNIQNAINIMANVSKPLATRPDVQITTRARGAAKEGLKKGDTGFETLQLNLGGDTTLKSEGGVGENDLYTVVSDGLKYRVTLNSFKGQKLNLDDISKDDIVSVVIVKPSETEKVDKFGGEIEMGNREKLVADFPEGEEDGMSNAIDAVSYMSRQDGVGVPEGEEIDKEKSDLNDDGEISSYERSRGVAIAKAMKKEQERAGQSHARAVADHYEDEDEPAEDNILPILGTGIAVGAAGAVGSHLMKKILPKDEQDDNDQYEPDEAPDDDQMGEMEPDEVPDEGEERCPITGKLRKKKPSESEEEEQVAMSQQDINNYLINQHRQKMQNAHSQERMNRHGY